MIYFVTVPKHITNLIIYGNSAEAMEAFSRYLLDEHIAINRERRNEGILICNRFFHLRKEDAILKINQKEQLRTKVLGDLLNYLDTFNSQTRQVFA